MIKVEIYRNKKNDINRFKVSGHAGYAESGNDIICSAVTVLTFNTVNSIFKFVNVSPVCETDEVTGLLDCRIDTDNISAEQNHDVQLLLKAMLNGLKDIKKNYGKFIVINDKEVLSEC